MSMNLCQSHRSVRTGWKAATIPSQSSNIFSISKQKKDLGLLTEEQVKALSRNTDATTNLEIKLLMRLQKFSEYSPEWAQITAIFGSRDRLAIARSLAAKYTQSAALKLVLSNVTGAEQAELGNLGLAEVRADLDAQDTSNPMLDSRGGQEQL